MRIHHNWRGGDELIGTVECQLAGTDGATAVLDDHRVRRAVIDKDKGTSGLNIDRACIRDIAAAVKAEPGIWIVLQKPARRNIDRHKYMRVAVIIISPDIGK